MCLLLFLTTKSISSKQFLLKFGCINHSITKLYYHVLDLLDREEDVTPALALPCFF